ncbi:MAG: polysaccharide biosynthesis tyrosine autokinase [Chthoniobacterales bacterium]
MHDVALAKSPMLKLLQGQGLSFDFKRYVFLLQRHLWLLLLIVGIGMAATVAWLLRQPKIYEARAVIQVEQFETKVFGSKVEDLQAAVLDTDDYLQTFAQDLTSNSLLIAVAQKLGLDKDPTLFPGVDKGTTYTEAMIADTMRGIVHVAIRKNTRLIDIFADDTKPERARDIAESIVQAYLRQNFEQQYKTSLMATQVLQERADELKKNLEAAEQKLQAYKEQHNSVSLEADENIITAKLKDLNARAIDAKNTRIRLESDIETLRKTPANDTQRMLQIGSVAALNQVATARGEVERAEADLAALQKRYLPLHPKYIAAVTTIQRYKQDLQDALRDAGKILEAQYSAAKESEDKLNALLNEQEQTALELSKLAIPYNTLKREVDSYKQMYDALNTRIRETTISQGVAKSAFHVVEDAFVPTNPIKPEVVKSVGIAFAVCLAAALALIILLDTLDDSIRSIDDAESFLGLPALAVIPETSKGGPPKDAFVNSDSKQAEAFRTLRASLSLLGTDDSARRVFLITSAVPAEGKSFSALSLAHGFALNGYRTVLVEGDMRRPTLYSGFPGLATRETPGLTDVLSGNRTVDEVLVQSPEENLNIIFAGSRAPNPAELLAHGALDTVVEELKKNFDRIIVDTAPINSVSDTLMMISAVQYVCLIVRPAKTRRRAIARAIGLIEKAKGILAGFVINRAKFGVGSGYYYYYYGDKYAQSK